MIDLGSLRLGFAFASGAATFFAPCAYPLLPGYVAYYLGESDIEEVPARTRLWRAGAVGVLVSSGFVLVYAVLAGVFMAVGAEALAGIGLLELVVGSLLVVLGVGMASGRLRPDRLHVRLPNRRRTRSGYVLFGIVYAAAAAGCTAPVFIAIALVGVGSGPIGAVWTVGTYAVGMSAMMIAVTALSALGRDALLRRLTHDTGRIARAAGVLLVIAGVVQIYLFLFEFNGFELLGIA